MFKSHNFFLIAGPCAIEGEAMAFEIAEHIFKICKRLGIPFIFKGSYRKANRSRGDSFTGIGDEKALRILQAVGEQFSIKTTTDIHTDDEAAGLAEKVGDVQVARLTRMFTLLADAGDEVDSVTNRIHDDL